MSAKPKKPSIRRVRLLLNVVVVILLTLVARELLAQWKNRKASEDLVYRCQLPDIPEKLKIVNAQLDEPHVFLSVVAHEDDSEVFDQWMGEVDQWKKKPPFGVLNFSFRESEKSLRVDFTAELRIAPGEGRP
ncbi:MAG: hypothetical protein ACON5H_07680 [Akkermansiaceae bacterium]